MNGHLIPNTPIVVDFWHVRECPNARIFFLTHMHADHTVGLTSLWRHTIYCSLVSKRLLQHKFSIDAGLIHTLEENESHIVPLDETGQETMTVTVIDANHCPGAVMYLFDGYFGRILYTGDLRYESWMLAYTAMAGATNIDVLYLDNTYNCSSFTFPKRAVAKEMVCDIIRRHPHHAVVIGVRNLGKEELLEYVAETLRTWIAVTQDHYKTLCALQRRSVFTTDILETSIRAVPMHQVTRAALRQWNKDRPTIAILPTALFFAAGTEKSPDMFVVPYSDHSSYDELDAFVKHVKPRVVIPIVGALSRLQNLKLSGITDMGHFSRHLDKTASLTYQVPATVTQWMTGHMSVHRRGRPCKKKTVQRSKKKKMGCEFTDMSPIKGKPNSPSADDRKLHLLHNQSYDRENLTCVGYVQSSVKSKQSSPLTNNLNPQQSHDKSCDEKSLTCVGFVWRHYKNEQSSLVADSLKLKQSHGQSHDKDNLTCVGFVRPCQSSVSENVVSSIGPSSPGQSTVTDKNVVNNIGPSSPGQSTVTDKNVVNNIGPSSPGQSTVTDKNVVNNIGPSSPGQNTVTDKNVVNNIGPSSPGQSTVTDKNVVNNIGPSSPGQSTVTDKNVVNNIGPSSPGQNTVTDKNVVNNIGPSSPGQSTVTYKNGVNNIGPSSPGQSTVTDKNGVNNIGPSSPGQSTVTDKNGINNIGPSSPGQSTVTDKNGINNIGPMSPGQNTVKDKNVVNNIGQLSPGQNTVTDKNGVNNIGPLSPGQNTVTNKNCVNNIGPLLPGQNTVTDKNVVNNIGPLSPGQNTVTNKNVVNNIGPMSPGQNTVKDKNVVNNIGQSSPGQNTVTDKNVVNNIGPLSPGQNTVIDKNVVNNIGDQTKDGFLSPAHSSLPNIVSGIDEVRVKCGNRTVLKAAKGMTEMSTEVTEFCKPKSARFLFKHVASSVTPVQHSLGTSHAETKNVRASSWEDMTTRQYGCSQTIARTQCPDSVDLLGCSGADLQKETSGHTEKSTAAGATVIWYVRHCALSASDNAQVLPGQSLLKHSCNSSERTSRVEILTSQVGHSETSCNIEMVDPQNVQNLPEVNHVKGKDLGNLHDGAISAQITCLKTFRDTQTQTCEHVRKSPDKNCERSSQVEVGMSQEGQSQMSCRFEIVNHVKEKHPINSHDGVVTSQITCIKTVGCTHTLTREDMQNSPGDSSTKEIRQRTSQVDVDMSKPRHTETSDVTRRETFAQDVQNCPRTHSRKLCNHSSIISLRTTPQPLVNSRMKGATAVRVTNKTHRLCESVPNATCSKRSHDSDITLYETDPDRMMDLMGPLLEEESRRLDIGHSWLIHT